jgi:hypothetical protein
MKLESKNSDLHQNFLVTHVYWNQELLTIRKIDSHIREIKQILQKYFFRTYLLVD